MERDEYAMTFLGGLDFGESRVGSWLRRFAFVSYYREKMIGYYVRCHVGSQRVFREARLDFLERTREFYDADNVRRQFSTCVSDL